MKKEITIERFNLKIDLDYFYEVLERNKEYSNPVTNIEMDIVGSKYNESKKFFYSIIKLHAYITPDIERLSNVFGYLKKRFIYEFSKKRSNLYVNKIEKIKSGESELNEEDIEFINEKANRNIYISLNSKSIVTLKSSKENNEHFFKYNFYDLFLNSGQFGNLNIPMLNSVYEIFKYKKIQSFLQKNNSALISVTSEYTISKNEIRHFLILYKKENIYLKDNQVSFMKELLAKNMKDNMHKYLNMYYSNIPVFEINLDNKKISVFYGKIILNGNFAQHEVDVIQEIAKKINNDIINNGRQIKKGKY